MDFWAVTSSNSPERLSNALVQYYLSNHPEYMHNSRLALALALVLVYVLVLIRHLELSGVYFGTAQKLYETTRKNGQNRLALPRLDNIILLAPPPPCLTLPSRCAPSEPDRRQLLDLCQFNLNLDLNLNPNLNLNGLLFSVRQRSWTSIHSRSCSSPSISTTRSSQAEPHMQRLSLNCMDLQQLLHHRDASCKPPAVHPASDCHSPRKLGPGPMLRRTTTGSPHPRPRSRPRLQLDRRSPITLHGSCISC